MPFHPVQRSYALEVEHGPDSDTETALPCPGTEFGKESIRQTKTTNAAPRESEQALVGEICFIMIGTRSRSPESLMSRSYKLCITRQ